ncbi:MAG TPA: formate dehydrogenase accessory sulfurtransferase FdhD, partial [Vicingus sp.]|nr:formate dehydrogenase accessory sulfurtransferase FdhD [Vicingus sp.]
KSEVGNGASIVRNIVSVSSCGICGKSELEKPTDTKLTNQQNLFTPQQLFNMFEKMNSAQDSFIQSGGSHACAVFDKEGKMLSIKEDVGRHNAVDKVIGNLINQNNLSNAKCLLVSGRISYEIVNKCFAAKIPILAAVSAPSSLAVDMAQEMGLTLIGFSRNNRFTVYAHPNRIVL